MKDPINRDDYNPYTKRDPNPERITLIKQRAEAYHAVMQRAAELRAELDDAIVDAHQTGHSFRQIQEASGISISSIQLMLTKRGVL